MKIPKILKVSEYSALCESKLKDIRVSGVVSRYQPNRARRNSPAYL